SHVKDLMLRSSSGAKLVAPPPPANEPETLPESVDRVPQAVQASSSTPPQLTQSSDELERLLVKRVKDYPRDVASQLDYQLLLYLRDQPIPQMAAIAGLPAEDREVVAALCDAVSNFRSA